MWKLKILGFLLHAWPVLFLACLLGGLATPSFANDLLPTKPSQKNLSEQESKFWNLVSKLELELKIALEQLLLSKMERQKVAVLLQQSETSLSKSELTQEQLKDQLETLTKQIATLELQIAGLQEQLKEALAMWKSSDKSLKSYSEKMNKALAAEIFNTNKAKDEQLLIGVLCGSGGLLIGVVVTALIVDALKNMDKQDALR